RRLRPAPSRAASGPATRDGRVRGGRRAGDAARRRVPGAGRRQRRLRLLHVPRARGTAGISASRHGDAGGRRPTRRRRRGAAVRRGGAPPQRRGASLGQRARRGHRGPRADGVVGRLGGLRRPHGRTAPRDAAAPQLNATSTAARTSPKETRYFAWSPSPSQSAANSTKIVSVIASWITFSWYAESTR